MDSEATDRESDPATSGSFPALPPDATVAEAEALLRGADWTAFDVERDLPGLRVALTALEDREGVTDAHRFATVKLRDRGALLRHPDGHQDTLSSHALSPDGRYFAVGSWIGDDYKRGGSIQIWEVATGRCVNMLDGIDGGLGWPAHRDNMQWTADGRVLASHFNTSMVGRWDPFGDQVHPPPADVDVASVNGPNRPVGYALDPDGTRIFIHYGRWHLCAETGVLGCLAPLRNSDFEYGHRAEPTWMAKPAAKLFASLKGAAIAPNFSVFSADGNRVWAFGEWIWPAEYNVPRESAVVSIDMVERRLDWFVDAEFERSRDGTRMSVSPDETLVALNFGRRLGFLDAATGERLAEAEIPHRRPQFVWGAGRRLAVIDVEGGGGVHVFDGTGFRHRLPLDPKPAKHSFADGVAWAWSFDGERAACLTATGRVELLDLVDSPHTVTVLDAPDDANGLWWGAGDVLIIGGPSSLVFHDLRTDTVVGDFRFGREVPRPRPLWNDIEDLGQEFRPNPTFALDENRWAVALPEGVVIAPDTDQTELDRQLAWSVDRRHSWPYRWGEAMLVPDVASCFDKLTISRKPLAPLREQRAVTGGATDWPPPDTATVDDLYSALSDALTSFDNDGRWDFAVAGVLRRAARQRARAGRAAEAEALIERIPRSEDRDHTRALAETALVLAAGGERTAAARLHREAVEKASDVDDHTVPFVAAAIGAGYHVLGEPGTAREWVERAVAAIDPYPNAWEDRLGVCWALLEGGLEDRARELWTEGEPGEPSDRSGFLAHLVRIGRDDLVRELYLGPDKPWDDVSGAWPVFLKTGRPDLLREYFGGDGRDLRDYEQAEVAEAERNARPDRPDEADLADLREHHAELLRTPLAQRREDTKRLAWRAAARGHYGAVLDLLRQVPNDDFNDRVDATERALWIALTGVDDYPW